MAVRDPENASHWHFILNLGGPDETVFFDV